MAITLAVDFVTETCCYKECAVTFAFTLDYFKQVNNDPSLWWYCPNGHRQHYTGKSDAQKLQESQARETALRDQLEAAVRDAEATRAALLRDRQRFANGVCPCCNRSFENVRRHMTSQHPDYDVTKVVQVAQPAFECSCGRSFQTLRGLHQHQSRSRGAGWFKPTASSWAAHLTVV